MAKVDLKKELKYLYQPSAKEVVEVEVPTFKYLMVDGEGDLNIQTFQLSLQKAATSQYRLRCIGVWTSVKSKMPHTPQPSHKASRPGMSAWPVSFVVLALDSGFRRMLAGPMHQPLPLTTSLSGCESI